MRLILIRHYKTQFNASGQIMGWGDSLQAENWQEDMIFVEQALRERAFAADCIYSSALGRSRRTAEHFAASFDISTVEVAPELNEINYGTLYKKCKKWVAQQYPRHKKDPDFVYPEGESFNQMQCRSVAFIRRLAAARAGQTVLCVAHAGVVRALLSHFMELNFAAQLRRKVSHRYIGVLTFSGGNCAAYDEWGLPSGFVSDGQLTLPYSRKTA